MPGPEVWAAPSSGAPAARAAAPPPGAEPAAEAGRTDLLRGEVPFRPLGVSEMLDGSLAAIRRNPRAALGPSVVISTVVQVLITLAGYYFIGATATDEITPTSVTRSLGTQFTLSLIGLVASAASVLLLSGLLAPVLTRTLFGLPATPGQAWRDARPRLPHLVVLTVLIMGLALVVLVVPVLPFVLLVAADAPPALGAVAAIFGFPLGLAAMIYVYVLFVLAVPAVVLERRGVTDALRRAVQLSRGRWWRTCATLVLTLLITVLMGFLVLRIPFLVIQVIFFGENPEGTALALALGVDTLGRIVSWTLVVPFDAGVIVLLYADRRMRREGFDLELHTRTDEAPGDFLELWRPSDLVPPPGTRPVPAPVRPPAGWTP